MKNIIFDGEWLRVPSTKIKKADVVELTTQVMKRGKQYTCSSAGKHGKLLRTYKCKSLDGINAVIRMYSSMQSWKSDMLSYDTKKIAFINRGKRAWFVGVYYTPGFYDDHYDTFNPQSRQREEAFAESQGYAYDMCFRRCANYRQVGAKSRLNK